MDEDSSLGSARPDEWGSAVVNGDATKLAELVLVWSGSRPKRALSILRDCVLVLEKEVALSASASSPLPSLPTTLGCIRNSCLNALIVALNETSDGKSWYTSTQELQLASLDFCMACRNYQTLHLRVDAQVPRRLLAAADAPQPHRKQLCGTRVPRLRARRVTWNIPTAAELTHPIFTIADADWLEFGRAFEDRLDAVAWPQRLRMIQFCDFSQFDHSIEGVSWPATLEKLVFSRNFNQHVDGVSWPPSLRVLELGWRFNQPIERVRWPASLQKLTFGICFNQPIRRVSWPDSLLRLTFGFRFNRPIRGVEWPASLQGLSFGVDFNQPIVGVSWPHSLQKLSFGFRFNQAVEGVSWPGSLEELSFALDFNQPIAGVSWPDSLQELSFGLKFNQPVEGVYWPASFRKLTVGGSFDQSIVGATWPPAFEGLRYE